jgi:hypothetical protein
LLNTLKTIQCSSKVNDIEVIITDDGSDKLNLIHDIPSKFNFPIHIIRVDQKDKWYTNPSVPYNMAIKMAKGDIIVLQNPEVMHTDDILYDIVKKINNDVYLTYGVYAANQITTTQLNKLDYSSNDVLRQIRGIINPLKISKTDWYNHSIHRPVGFHFLTAITRKNMVNLNGFDERYATGIDYDDSELLHRIKRNNIQVVFIDDLVAVHQQHPKMAYNYTNLLELREKNKDLFFNTTLKETGWQKN